MGFIWTLNMFFDPQFFKSKPLPVRDTAEWSESCSSITQIYDSSEKTRANDRQQQANTAHRDPKVCECVYDKKQRWQVVSLLKP